MIERAWLLTTLQRLRNYLLRKYQYCSGRLSATATPATTVLARPLSESPGQWQWLRVAPSAEHNIHTGTLHQLHANVSHDTAIWVAAPGVDITTQSCQIHTKKRRQAQQALPFALEEQLADELEKLHIHLLHHSPIQTYAWVVDRRSLQQWQSEWQQAGLTLAGLIPDYALLPHSTAHWSVVVTRHWAFMRGDRYQGFTVETDTLPALLQLIAKQQPTLSLIVWPTHDATDMAAALGQYVQHCEIRPPLQSPLQLWAEQLVQLPRYFNLCPPQRRVWPSDVNSRTLWRITGPLVLASALFTLLGHGLEYHILQQLATRQAQQISTLYRQVFPQAKRAIKPRFTITRALQQRVGTVQRPGLLHLIAQLTPSLHLQPSITVRQLQYQHGQLQLQLTASNPSAINALQAHLAAQQLPVTLAQQPHHHYRLTLSEPGD